MKYLLFFLPAIYAFSLASCAQNTSTNNAKTEIKHVNATEFENSMLKNPDALIIDVRTSEEFASGYIDGAKNLDIYSPNFEKEINALDKNKPVFVYCKGGGRSADAAQIMKKSGFQNIYELDGGIMAWANKNLPIVNAQSAASDKFTTDNFNQLLKENQLVLVDFYAPWCGPCKKMEPVLSKLAEEYKGKIRIERINVDEASALSRALKIENIPVITSNKNGAEINRVNGFQTEEQLRAIITELLQ